MLFLLLGLADQFLYNCDGLKRPKMAGNSSFHVVELGTVTFNIPTVYTDAVYIGGGTYGNVIKATDSSTAANAQVAIKKLYQPFRDGLLARRAFRELRLLSLMQHENIIELVDLFTPDQTAESLTSVYIVTTHAGWSLMEVLRKERERERDGLTKILENNHHAFILYQILRGLKYIHSAQVIHRDLKPSNLALSADCSLTILDFGLARTVSGDVMTEYVMARWYRAPEVMYWNVGVYDAKADMWSVGCILGEILLGKPVFPGEEVLTQFRLITQLCGSPDVELLEKIGRTSSATRLMIESFERYPRKDFSAEFPGASPDAIDFLDRLLVLDPDKRMSVDEALAHNYLVAFRMPEDEPIVNSAFVTDEADVSVDDLNGWRRKIWNEIQNFRARRMETSSA